MKTKNRKEGAWYENDGMWREMRDYLFAGRASGTPQEVDHLLARLGLEPGERVLDLGCGPGRHALELARRGGRVTGVDRTAGYLARARQSARAEGLAVEWVRSDMRDFCRPGAFDAAINLFTTFGYFDDPSDDARVLRRLFRSLRPGGRLLIDTLGKEILARGWEERTWCEENGVLTLSEISLVGNWERLHNRWIRIAGKTRREYHFEVRLYAAADLEARLREAGFVRVEIFGSLDGSPYDHQARRLVAVAWR